MPEYFKVGKLIAVHGLKGELLLKHTLGKKTSLRGLQAIFVEDEFTVAWCAGIGNDDEVEGSLFRPVTLQSDFCCHFK